MNPIPSSEGLSDVFVEKSCVPLTPSGQLNQSLRQERMLLRLTMCQPFPLPLLLCVPTAAPNPEQEASIRILEIKGQREGGFPLGSPGTTEALQRCSRSKGSEKVSDFPKGTWPWQDGSYHAGLKHPVQILYNVYQSSGVCRQTRNFFSLALQTLP